jgi:hypothetical protein
MQEFTHVATPEENAYIEAFHHAKLVFSGITNGTTTRECMTHWAGSQRKGSLKKGHNNMPSPINLNRILSQHFIRNCPRKMGCYNADISFLTIAFLSCQS